MVVSLYIMMHILADIMHDAVENGTHNHL